MEIKQMLNEEQCYKENQNDFDEINNSIEKMGFYSIPPEKKQAEDDKEKLPFYVKLIIFACGFAFGGYYLLQYIWVLIITKGDLDNITPAQEVGVISACYFTLFAISLFFIIKYRKYFAAKLKNPTKYLQGLIFGLVTVGIEMAVSMIMNSILPADTNANQQAIMDYTNCYPILMFFVTVFIGPLCEEMTYRVGLFEAIKEKNETAALIATSLIFAVIHISFSNTTIEAELNALPVYITIGFCLTYAYKKHGLACSYVAHVFLNLLSFLSILTQM